MFDPFLGIFMRLIHSYIDYFLRRLRSCWLETVLVRKDSFYGRAQKTNLRLFLRYYTKSLDGIAIS